MCIKNKLKKFIRLEVAFLFLFSSSIYLPEYLFLSSNFRRVHTVEFKLKVGKIYTPEQLRQKGYTLKEITLEGIVDPEAIPEDEEFVVYEVKRKDGCSAGWLWRGMFFGERELREMYNHCIERHASIDVRLKKEDMVPESGRKLDLLRHKLHLWAALFFICY